MQSNVKTKQKVHLPDMRVDRLKKEHVAGAPKTSESVDMGVAGPGKLVMCH
jgi:hypothetical protein